MTEIPIDKQALEAARRIARDHSFSALTYDEHCGLVDEAVTTYLAALPPTTDGVRVTVREWTQLIADLDAAMRGQPDVTDQWWLDCGTIRAKLTRIMASLNISEAEPVADDDGFVARDFIDLASQLRSGHEVIRRAALSNNFNVVLAALDRCSAPTTSLQAPEGVRDDVLATAARELIASRFDTYRAGNNRQVGIQDDNGEKCWIVPFDEMAALEAALKRNRT
jgi:hypothetical protein